MSDENTSPGLICKVYEGRWQRLPDFSKLKPVAETTVDKVSLHPAEKRKEHFGVSFSGLVKIPETGLYFLSLKSDDGSRIWIGNHLIVNNDGLGERRAVGGIRLAAGLHPLKIDFFQKGGEKSLEFRLRRAGHQDAPPKFEFFHKN